MSFLNKEQPLGLPKGSIRSIITLELITTSVVSVLLNIKIPEWFYGAVVAVVAFYFGVRDKK